MSITSQINPALTPEYMRTVAENKYFERKNVRIRPARVFVCPLSPSVQSGCSAVSGECRQKRKTLLRLPSIHFP